MTTATRIDLPQLFPSDVSEEITALLQELGDGSEANERECYQKLLDRDFEAVKAFRTKDLNSNYYRCLNYVVSAIGASDPKSPAHRNYRTIYAEAAMACADHAKDRTLRKLSGLV